MNDYDQASRYTAKLDPPGFLRWLLGEQTPLRFREWYDTTNAPLPGGEGRTSDTIALMDNNEDPEEPFAVAVEFETENDAEILERELEYLAIIRRRLRRRGFKVDRRSRESHRRGAKQYAGNAAAESGGHWHSPGSQIPHLAK